jgi:hypothetical protein
MYRTNRPITRHVTSNPDAAVSFSIFSVIDGGEDEDG